jgi:hypothetical protein
VRTTPCLLAAVLASASPAWGRGPPTVVHTKDGSVYYGDLVERVVDDHVTILNAAGEIKRFPMKDIDPSPIPVARLYQPPPPAPPPTATVRTKNGSVYYGEIIEKVVGDHVTLRLETGQVKTLGWEDVDLSPAPPPRSVPRAPAPIENVWLANGGFYRGTLLERVKGDHVTVQLVTGAVVTVAWRDLARRRPGRPKENEVLVDFKASPSGAKLERKIDVGWETLCVDSCAEFMRPRGVYRVTGEGRVPSAEFALARHNDSHVSASLGPLDARAGGIALTAVGAPAVTVGIVMLFVATGANRYGDKTSLDAATIAVNLIGTAMLVTGITLIALAKSSVTVNGTQVATLGPRGLRW